MASDLKLSGFDDLLAELAALPTAARDESKPLLVAHARRAQAAIVAGYPEITGRLRAGVQIIERAARGAAAIYSLVSSAPYAHIVEFGSARTRPRANFLPVSSGEQRASVVAVAGIVESKGLTVRGARD